MTSTQETKVTLTDCGKALEAFERELKSLIQYKREIERRITALETHTLITRKIAQLGRNARKNDGG